MLDHVAKRGCGISILGGVQDSAREVPEQPAPFDWFYAAGWTGWPLEMHLT